MCVSYLQYFEENNLRKKRKKKKPTCKKKSKKREIATMGFEPILADSKSAVLTGLHYAACIL